MSYFLHPRLNGKVKESPKYQDTYLYIAELANIKEQTAGVGIRIYVPSAMYPMWLKGPNKEKEPGLR